MKEYIEDRPVWIDRFGHGLPAAVAEHFAAWVVDGRNFAEIAAAGHVGLAHHDKGMDIHREQLPYRGVECRLFLTLL